ncbi:hypothetical protein VTO42DRAFT_7360 [Malbranchea cinnamomea]
MRGNVICNITLSMLEMHNFQTSLGIGTLSCVQWGHIPQHVRPAVHQDVDQLMVFQNFSYKLECITNSALWHRKKGSIMLIRFTVNHNHELSQVSGYNNK